MDKDKFQTQSGGMRVKEGHEGDFSVRGIIVFAVFLALGLVLTFIIAGVLMKVFEWGSRKYVDAGMTPVQEQLQRERGLSEPQQNQYQGEKTGHIKPSSETELRATTERNLERTFARPRLQYDDVNEMNSFRKAENEYLDCTVKDSQGNTHPCIFKDDQGHLHIPIAQAIKRLSDNGLPSVSGTWSPQAPGGVPTGESRESSNQIKDNRGINKGVTPH